MGNKSIPSLDEAKPYMRQSVVESSGDGTNGPSLLPWNEGKLLLTVADSGAWLLGLNLIYPGSQVFGIINDTASGGVGNTLAYERLGGGDLRINGEPIDALLVGENPAQGLCLGIING